MKSFKTFLKKQIKYLDGLEANWAQLDAPWETTEYMIQETADRAARLGLSDLYKKSLDLRGGFQDCRWYLAECLSSIKTESDILTVQEAANKLGISANKVYDLVKQGKLFCQRIGKSIRFRPDDLIIRTSGKFKHL
jgi:excisionase family DNA binding protein